MRTTYSLLALACTVLLNGSPAAAEQSGFLGDYSMLRPGKSEEADLVYVKYDNDHAKWDSFKQILLEPVQVWKGKGTDLHHDHAEYLAKILWSRLDAELEKDYKMTRQPGPGVLRIQIAITQAGAGENAPIGEIRTALIPDTRLIYEKKDWTTSTEAFVEGEVAAEMKVTDAESGELLGAAVDRRGGPYDTKHPGEWSDVDAIITYWAKKIRWRLCTVRSGIDCHKP
ncbi:MAG: DUF3313 domain-containing protein [Nitrospiraceae bacterium]